MQQMIFIPIYNAIYIHSFLVSSQSSMATLTLATSFKQKDKTIKHSMLIKPKLLETEPAKSLHRFALSSSNVL